MLKSKFYNTSGILSHSKHSDIQLKNAQSLMKRKVNLYFFLYVYYHQRCMLRNILIVIVDNYNYLQIEIFVHTLIRRGKHNLFSF